MTCDYYVTIRGNNNHQMQKHGCDTTPILHVEHNCANHLSTLNHRETSWSLSQLILVCPCLPSSHVVFTDIAILIRKDIHTIAITHVSVTVVVPSS
jgi:hypothetical protein